LTSADAVVDASVVCGQCGITSWIPAADAKATADLKEASTAVPNLLTKARLCTTDPDAIETGRVGMLPIG
jgi:hypothetical protein